jgi:Type II secretion system (T2SS), protein M subtype b
MLKKLPKKDQVALIACAVAVGLFVVVQFGLFPALDSQPQSDGGVQTKEMTLQRSQRLVKESLQDQTKLAAARERLANLESGLLESPSASLANAEWQRLVREQADSQGIELNSSEFLHAQDLGNGYSLVLGRVQLRCRMDQLLQFLVALANSPKLLSVTHLRISALQGDQQDRVNAELSIGAPMRTAKPAKSAQGPKS